MKKLVNMITLTRIIATLFLPLVWYNCNPLIILIFVSIILLTDFFDGFLARSFHVQSLFGCLADTVADKIFGIIILLIIASFYPLYYILVVMEFIIAFINIVAAFRGATTKSSFLGRFKMWILGASIFFGLTAIFNSYLSKLDMEILSMIIKNRDNIIGSSIFITSGAQLMVAIDYARHIIKELKNKNHKIKYQFKDDEELMKVLFDTEYFLSHKDLPLSKHLLK